MLEILRESSVLAVVGLSSKPDRAGYYVPAYMQRAGYTILPVNPALDHALGVRAFADLQDVPQPVDCVLIFRRPEFVPAVVEQAIAIKARYIWMQLGIRSEPAAQKARAAGLGVIMDACIMVEHRRLANRLDEARRGMS